MSESPGRRLRNAWDRHTIAVPGVFNALAARMAEQLLGQIAVGLRGLSVRRFVIAGGETSGAVVEALRIRALAVGPYEAPGQSKAVAIAQQPLSFYLKSGKLGPVDMFERVLDDTTSASSA